MNLRFLAIYLCVSSFAFAYATSSPSTPSVYVTQAESVPKLPDLSQLEDPLSGQDHLMADQLASSISNAEWLGVMAPIAISPFFGITCLCGMSQFGGEALGTNSFISSNPVLNNPAVFWIFLALTIFTSLPRLTKVSKPIAQAIDQVEAYSGIITLLIMRYMANSGVPEDTTVVMQMGMMSMSADVLMSIAAIINIVVINTVKFFFEIMVWLIPIPFVDAMLEAANKATCAGLMAIYAYSPFLATIMNLILFAICLVAFFWIRRRVIYAKALLIDPLIAMISPSFGVPKKSELIVFQKGRANGLPAKQKLRLRTSTDGWELIPYALFGKPDAIAIQSEKRGKIKPGWLMNELSFGDAETEYVFSKRYSNHLDELAQEMQLEIERHEEGEKTLDMDFA